ncbi:MAG: DUF3892 domain-containing protein [Acetobacter malorum]|uniref:DUF3892 domain-containing protein n=1 Tax=Acetobacter TaxID=434 RepID=UPI001EDBFCB9|nr:DUF3892 domain-containing protein [Acetobacter senegalensis]MCG4260854.1 DUF3892 domain-containing protein [Acetobacter senegalensis]
MSNFDYYVTAVKFNSDNTHISELKVHKILQGGWSKNGEIMTRPEVVRLIKGGKKFQTIFLGNDSKWKSGSELQITTISTEYLKTGKDSSTKDNLDNLPLIP